MTLEWNLTCEADLEPLPLGTHIVSTDGGICRKFGVGPGRSRWWAVNNGTDQMFPAAILFSPADLDTACGSAAK